MKNDFRNVSRTSLGVYVASLIACIAILVSYFFPWGHYYVPGGDPSIIAPDTSPLIPWNAVVEAPSGQVALIVLLVSVGPLILAALCGVIAIQIGPGCLRRSLSGVIILAALFLLLLTAISGLDPSTYSDTGLRVWHEAGYYVALISELIIFGAGVYFAG